ncbi:MAG TPA: STAS domain-containing protein [Spirochaetota bacterium]|nr:STAS domain-containing protein [Spirochaetota bacterium]HOL57951.1 STAS domain-containing protein [Spirochaetota bacterium]HPP04984.1 STAS domain-containing protein [Spirochaetota bacterium]
MANNKKEIKIEDSIRLTITEENDITLITIKGYIDYSNYLDFQREINFFIKNNAKIIFICKELNYISSSGIASFVQFAKKIEEKKGKVVLVNIQNKIQEIFNLIKMSNFLLITDNINKAREILK